MDNLINYNPNHSKNNQGVCKRLSAGALLCLTVLGILSVLPLNLTKASRAFFPATPPVTPPATPPATPTPTVARPSVTPSPIPYNFPPVISGPKKLPVGRVLKKYRAQIRGYDLNPKDKLTMQAVNLPAGIRLESCQNSATGSKSMITCSLSGVPQNKGAYKITVLLSDDKGGSTQKEFILQVVKTNH